MGVLILLAALASSRTTPAESQHDDSLPAMARRHGGEAHLMVDACGWMYFALPDVARAADIILHGTLATERGRLSENEQTVYTEYEVVPFRILKGPAVSTRPGPVVNDRFRVVLPGGSIEHEGLVITMTINTVPHAERFRWGAEVVLFLMAHESEPRVYHVLIPGAFRVVDGQVVTMTREIAKLRGDRPEPLAAFLERVQHLVASAGVVR